MCKNAYDAIFDTCKYLSLVDASKLKQISWVHGYIKTAILLYYQSIIIKNLLKKYLQGLALTRGERGHSYIASAISGGLVHQ